MTHVKKLVMQGFKSFARRTEIPFENSMNVIVGPNGSGKSNITDALCFVLGRLSIKSIRAAKAANLLFSGNKTYKGSNEAYVELVFDNTDKSFAFDSTEVAIRRVVRKNGQSIYKINDQTKTRQDLLELLSQAGIDPNGFNIVLQGEIQSLVKATPEERRKIIEEVAGISIYEARKHKSLLELDKTEERLKEVGAVLKERTAYLRNLEKEKQDAQNYQKLEETIKRSKKSLLLHSLKHKESELWGFEKEIESYIKETEKIKTKIVQHQAQSDSLQKKIEEINRKVQDATSNEQESLHKELSDLKAELAGLEVRRENHDTRILSGNEKLLEIKEKIARLEEEILEVQKKSPQIQKQRAEQGGLQKKFDLLEQQRRRFYLLKGEIATLEHQRTEKNRLLIESHKESGILEQGIVRFFDEITHAKSFEEAQKLRSTITAKIHECKIQITNKSADMLKKEKEMAVLEQDILREERITSDILRLEVCSVCKQKVGEGHKHEISKTSKKQVEEATKKIIENKTFIDEAKELISRNESELEALQKKLSELDIDEIKLRSADERKEHIQKLVGIIHETEKEIQTLGTKIAVLRKEYEPLKNVEEAYDEIRVKLNELSFADLDMDTDVSIRQREINRMNLERKSVIRDIEESQIDLKKADALIEEKRSIMEKKQKLEQELYEKFEKYFGQKNELQDQQKVLETDVIGYTHLIKNLDDKINHVKIQKAQYEAQADALKEELREFEGLEPIKEPIEHLKEKLQNAQFKMSRLGNVNLKALDVFEQVEEQCKMIKEKVETIENEKEQILKIIEEIDKKKKKNFIGTLAAINDNFSRNFQQLSRKGEVFLELENKKEPFEGGLNILVKVSRGRYFDITSLSGGEKTLVALSLIFSIQEYKPYCFYIFDEIDAALDKKNSELLAALIKKYMKTGQYIIITHNDTLISEATNLYGVSMQENISKVISLKV